MKKKKLLGVYVRQRKNPLRSKKPFLKQNLYIIELLKIAEKIGMRAVVFCYDDIDWKNKTIKSYILNEKKKPRWILETLPFPDIVYDRAFSEKKQDVRNLVRVHDEFTKLGIKFINQRAFIRLVGNKWNFYKTLNKNKKLKVHLPETIRYVNTKDVKNLLNKHKSIILKPIMGKQGEGVIMVEKLDQKYRINYQRIIKGKVRFYEKSGGIEEIDKVKNSLSRGRKYIAQQKINSAKFKNRSFDIRVVLQKVKSKWDMIGMASRVANKKSAVSNLIAGGQLMPVQELSKGLEFKINRIKIKQVCMQFAKYIDKNISETGEMAFDLMFDEKGRIWVIEINSKFGRYLFRTKGLRYIRDRMIKNPVLYAKYLINNKNKND